MHSAGGAASTEAQQRLRFCCENNTAHPKSMYKHKVQYLCAEHSPALCSVLPAPPASAQLWWVPWAVLAAGHEEVDVIFKGKSFFPRDCPNLSGRGCAESVRLQKETCWSRAMPRLAGAPSSSWAWKVLQLLCGKSTVPSPLLSKEQTCPSTSCGFSAAFAVLPCWKASH